MVWAVGFGAGGTFREALERAVSQAGKALGDDPDLLLFFATRPIPKKEIPLMRRGAGLPGAPVLAGGRVHQVWKPGAGWTRVPAVALLAGSFPFPCVQALRFRPEVLPSPDGDPLAWRRTLGFQGPPPAALLLLAGLKAYHLAPLLPGLQAALPGTTLAGGVLGPGGARSGTGSVFLENLLPPEEALGLALDPPVSMEVLSLSAYRPLGPPHLVGSMAGEEVKELDGKPAWEILRAERPDNQSPGNSSLLAEVSSHPPGEDGSLPCGVARVVVHVGKRVRILTPGGLREGQWIRFCLPEPEGAWEKIRALPPFPREGEGCALLIACPTSCRDSSRDPAWALAERLGGIPFLGVRSWAQIAALPGCGPLLLGQSLVLCRFREDASHSS
ncbi:MAG TPA: hypothetical protein ENJ97_04040, partial [Planctomycetes bacterium]|nr:hypothetical protein [Planctomycetota bacterium]